jgi:SWI/SNF-related matrix-associated actin-dependent regulator of chromatin subfamily A3
MFRNSTADSLLIIDVKAQLKISSESPYHHSHYSEGLYIVFKISLVGDYFELLYQGQKLARMNKNFCVQARRLIPFGVEFQAYLRKADWDSLFTEQSHYVQTSSTTLFTVEVNVYSFRHHADRVGNILSQANFFLQTPGYDSGEVPYCNPQKLEFEGFKARQEGPLNAADNHIAISLFADKYTGLARDPEHPQQDLQQPESDLVDSVLNSLSHKDILHENFEINTDQYRIRTLLLP